MRNYLLRLGWSHGDEEIISTEQAVALFDLGAVGRSPARFDLAKLTSLNAHYLRERPDAELAELIRPRLGRGRSGTGRRRACGASPLGMPGLKQRARTLVELAAVGGLLCPAAADPARREGARSCWTRRRGPPSPPSWRRSAARPSGARPRWRLSAAQRAEAAGIGFGKLAQPCGWR